MTPPLKTLSELFSLRQSIVTLTRNTELTAQKRREAKQLTTELLDGAKAVLKLLPEDYADGEDLEDEDKEELTALGIDSENPYDANTDVHFLVAAGYVHLASLLLPSTDEAAEDGPSTKRRKLDSGASEAVETEPSEESRGALLDKALNQLDLAFEVINEDSEPTLWSIFLMSTIIQALCERASIAVAAGDGGASVKEAVERAEGYLQGTQGGFEEASNLKALQEFVKEKGDLVHAFVDAIRALLAVLPEAGKKSLVEETLEQLGESMDSASKAFEKHKEADEPRAPGWKEDLSKLQGEIDAFTAARK
ncbi:hypothetical protein RQP46_001709 [Phenoliferia psychrophenolica]